MSLPIRVFRTATTVQPRATRASLQIQTINRSSQENNRFVRGFRSSVVKMGVHNLANKTEFKEAIEKNSVVVLDAFATWCGPCKVIAPTVVKFSEEFPSAHFVKIDVDEVSDVAQELGIRAMPTFIVFKDGEKVKEIVGANPNALKAAIAEVATAEEKKE